MGRDGMGRVGMGKHLPDDGEGEDSSYAANTGADPLSSLPSRLSPDPHPPGSPGNGQAATVTLRQPLDIPGVDEDKRRHDREGDAEGQPWGQVPPDLGQVFHSVRGHASAVGAGVAVPRAGAMGPFAILPPCAGSWMNTPNTT